MKVGFGVARRGIEGILNCGVLRIESSIENGLTATSAEGRLVRCKASLQNGVSSCIGTSSANSPAPFLQYGSGCSGRQRKEW